jgi:parallel beta-helix repeat protein
LNSDCGIHLRYSNDNDLSNNTVRSNRLGIHLLDYSRNNTVNGNFLSNNSEDIKAADNSDNHIHNNKISDRDILQTPSYNHFFGSNPLNREVIDRHGKLPLLETEEQKQNWSDSLEELGKSARHGTNGRTGLFPNYMYPNGKVLSCGENSLGYFVVVFYKNLTIEKQLIYEIYTIIDETARDMGIQEIPVEFESAVFRYDGGDIDVLANLKAKQKIPLEEYMNVKSASYRPDAIATYGKLPEIETEEQCWEWFQRDTRAIMHGSRDSMEPYFTDGILVSCGSYIDGYIEVTIYENLTIETQPIMDEIYEILDYEAKKIGISDVPVVFFEGEFVQPDPGLLVEDSDDVMSPADDLDESVPGFGLLGGLVSFFGGWLFRRWRA